MSCSYEFIKRYLTSGFVPGTVDAAAKFVYVAARNLVFGLTCCHAPPGKGALQVNSQKLGL